MYSICTGFLDNANLADELKGVSKGESKFTKDIGVLFRKFFQCTTHNEIIWSITEWISEKHHNQAANSLMKTRYDDRFASIAFGPSPYFEIFCEEDQSTKIGHYSDELQLIIVGHGLISERAKDKYLQIRHERLAEFQKKIPWLSIYVNAYNSDEFVAYLGFKDETEYQTIREINGMLLEEYLFTGLRKVLGMSLIANYNQYVCKPLPLGEST